MCRHQHGSIVVECSPLKQQFQCSRLAIHQGRQHLRVQQNARVTLNASTDQGSLNIVCHADGAALVRGVALVEDCIAARPPGAQHAELLARRPQHEADARPVGLRPSRCTHMRSLHGPVRVQHAHVHASSMCSETRYLLHTSSATLVRLLYAAHLRPLLDVHPPVPRA